MESDTERDVPNLSPTPNPSGHHQQPLRLVKSTAFKREERRKRKDRKRQGRLADELARWQPLGAPAPLPAATGSMSPSRAQPDTPWPCDPPLPPDPAEADSWSWGPPATPTPTPPQPTVEASAAVPLHPQAVAVKSCRAFFASQVDDDEEEENEGNAARFFSELLGSDAALRGFYEAERDKGHFLVPGVRGQRRQGGQEVCRMRRARAARRVDRPDQEEAGAPRVRRRPRTAAWMGRRPDRSSAGKHHVLMVPRPWICARVPFRQIIAQ